MKLCQNSASTVLFLTKEGKRNENNLKSAQEPRCSGKAEVGVLYFEGRPGARWNDRKKRLFKPVRIHLAWERLQAEGWIAA